MRFSAQLGFSIEEDTKRAAKTLAHTLEHISAERIQTELVKLLTSPYPQYLKTAWELGLTKIFLPEFDREMETPQNNPHHQKSVGEHTLKALETVEPDKVLRLAALFHDMGKPECRSVDQDGRDHFRGHQKVSEEISQKVLRRLRFDNDTIYKVKKLVYWHECPWDCTPASVRRALHKIGPELFSMLLKLRQADILAQSDHKRQEKLERLQKIEILYKEILDKKECFAMSMLAVSGKDLINAGMEPGKEIGDTLNRFMEIVLEEPEKNTKEYLLSLLV